MRQLHRERPHIVRVQKQKTIRVVIVGNQHFCCGVQQAIRHHTHLVIVSEISSGAEAVTMVEQQLPDVVLLGPQLPDIDALAITKQLVEILPSLNVLMLTDEQVGERVVAAMEAGVSGYLPASIKAEALARAITGVANGEVALSRRTLACVLHHFRQTPRLSDNTKLTNREIQILRLIAAGATDKQISRHLSIAESTAKKHIQRIFYTLRAHNRAEAVAKFQELHEYPSSL
jgi:DNA-binding NarL/FixJ family response regulator